MADEKRKAEKKQSKASKRKGNGGFWDAVIEISDNRYDYKTSKNKQKTIRKANKEETKRAKYDMQGSVRTARALTGTNLGGVVNERSRQISSIFTGVAGVAGGVLTGDADMVAAAIKASNASQVAEMSAPPRMQSAGTGIATEAPDKDNTTVLAVVGAVVVTGFLVAKK